MVCSKAWNKTAIFSLQSNSPHLHRNVFCFHCSRLRLECEIHLKLLLSHSAISSSTVSVEEETRESYHTDIKLPDKFRTLELKAESEHLSSTLEKKKEKPVFLCKLSPAAATVGETFVFTVKVSGFPKPTVQWFHNGQKITTSSSYTFLHEEEVCSLVIDKVQKQFEGEYSCTVRNRFGQSTCSSYLFVHLTEPQKEEKPLGKPPNFVKALESVQVSEGGECFFRYTLTGDPLPQVQWFKGSIHIGLSGFYLLVHNPDGSGFLDIKGVRQEHSGVYTCKASNLYGEDSCSAELFVFSQKVQEDSILVQKTKGLKISMTEQSTESRLSQERGRSDQMIYTISTDDRQIIASEEVGKLKELNISAATLHREQFTHQAAVLQSHAVQERVSVAPAHPPEVSAVSTKQLHVATFLSSVQEKQKITEEHSERIHSPEIVELRLSKEQPSKVMSATSEEVLPLVTVRAKPLIDQTPEHMQTTTEPRQLVSGHQVESAVSVLNEPSGVLHRPEEERGFRVKEGVKILYSAQSAGQLLLSEAHSEPLPPLDTAIIPLIEKEQPKLVLAPVSEARVTLSKEQTFETQRPTEQTVRTIKGKMCKSGITCEEKYQLQAEQSGQVAPLESPVSLQPLCELHQVLNLQVVSDQDVLQSEGMLSGEKPFTEQAEVRTSPTLLHSVTQEEQRTVICEGTSELSEKLDYTSIQPKKEQPHAKYLQSVHSRLVLPKEGILTFTKPHQQEAVIKQEKVRSHAATSEMRREISADYHKDIDLSVDGINLQLQTESRPPNILSVSSQPLQLPKETPFITDYKPQRALVQREHYWNIMQSLNVTDTQTLEEGHTTNLVVDEKFKPIIKTEATILKKPVFIEEKAAATESCTILEAAEEDFAVQIQEGQSIRQSVLLEEKQILMGEQSREMYKSEASSVSVRTQAQQLVYVHESQECHTLPKELHFVVNIPKATRRSIQCQLRHALQSAVATDQPVLLAEVLGRLEAVEVQEVQVLRESRRTTCTYLITSPGVPMEVTLSFDGEYPQSADLRSELQVALKAMVFQEQQSLTSEELGILQTERSEKIQVSSVPSKEMLSTVVDSVMVAETVAGFAAEVSQSAAVRTESSTDQSQTETSKAVLVSQTKIRSGIEVSAAEVTTTKTAEQVLVKQQVGGFVHRESREEYISEAILISESSHSLIDHPVVTEALQDVCAEENQQAVFTTTIKHVTKVNWFFNGQLVKSGKEFKCSTDKNTHTLVINKVSKERHQGEFVCEAENEAGRTTTSSRLTVVTPGLMMDSSLISSSTNFTHCFIQNSVVSKPQTNCSLNPEETVCFFWILFANIHFAV